MVGTWLAPDRYLLVLRYLVGTFMVGYPVVYIYGTVRYRYGTGTVLNASYYSFVSHLSSLFYVYIPLCGILTMLSNCRTVYSMRRAGYRAKQLASITLGTNADVVISLAMGDTAIALATAIAKCIVYCYC